MKNSGIECVPLSQLTKKPKGEIQNFGAYSLCNLIVFLDEGIPFVKVENYNEFGIDWNSVMFISAEVHEQLPKSKLKFNDVLLSMAGTIGVSTVFEEKFESNSNQAIAKIRLSDDRISPRFLSDFLNTRLGLLQSKRISNGGVQANINLGEIGTILVPLLTHRQQIDLTSSLQDARNAYTASLNRASKLLSTIDQYIYASLGLPSLPEEKKRVFAVRLKQVIKALNPDRYALLSLEKSVKGKMVSDIAEIIETKVAPFNESPGEEWDWIRIDDLPNQPLSVQTIRTELGTSIEGTFYQVQQNDILLARLGPTIQNAKFVLCPKLERQTVASSEFYVLRCRKGCNPLVVLWVLRTKLFRHLMYSKGRGGTPSRYRLSREDLAALPFPVIDEKLQHQLAAEISNRLGEIKRLRDEANKEWSTAKERFEKRLLGVPNK